MDYDRLKKEVREIAEIAASVPEQFRDRCFEILLQSLVTGTPRSTTPQPGVLEVPATPPAATRTQRSDESGRLPLPAQVRVFLQRTGVTEDQLNAVMTYADEDIHFLREPSPPSVAQGQIEWALLLALKNGILKNNFSVDPEDVRSICQEKGFYDRGNFASYFKKDRNAKLFRNPLEPQGEAQALSADGQAALGSLIKSLAEKTE